LIAVHALQAIDAPQRTRLLLALAKPFALQALENWHTRASKSIRQKEVRHLPIGNAGKI
jgi:hypothetical protein